jgi:DNA topoisomerase I
VLRVKAATAFADASTAQLHSATSLTDPVESAKAAGLRYVSDDAPGYKRAKRGKGFVYLTAQNKPVRNPEDLQRIKSVAIPPAWRDVWICSLGNGHLQATGRDARGRKQHRYHPRWREVRDQTKYDKILAFAQQLPAIRGQVEMDLALPGLPREKVLATVVRLLETGMMRVGNEEYARQNKSFGVATLRSRHVNVSGPNIRFEFRGKSGVQHALNLSDRRLARIIKQCQELPGHELFQYIDEDGARCAIGSADVNEYLRAIAGDDFSSKDFRTWAGTVLAARALAQLHHTRGKAVKKNIAAAIEAVARQLGNTKAVCRKCYVHPVVFEAYQDGSLAEISRRPRKNSKALPHALQSDEAAVLALLTERLKNGSATHNSRLTKQLRRSLNMAKRGTGRE